MGKPKHSKPSKISSGQTSKIHIAQEEKRQAKFAARREAGKVYKYEPIKEKKYTKKWWNETRKRQAKNASSRTDYARWTGFFAAQDYRLRKEAEEKQKAKKTKKAS